MPGTERLARARIAPKPPALLSLICSTNSFAGSIPCVPAAAGQSRARNRRTVAQFDRPRIEEDPKQRCLALTGEALGRGPLSGDRCLPLPDRNPTHTATPDRGARTSGE